MNGCRAFVPGGSAGGIVRRRRASRRREAKKRGRMHNDISVLCKTVPEYFCTLQQTCQTHDASQREPLQCVT